MEYGFKVLSRSPTKLFDLGKSLSLPGLPFSMDQTNHPYNYLFKHVSLLKYNLQKVRIVSVVFTPHPQSLAQYTA